MGASQTTGVTAAVWSIVASLIAFELAAGIRSKADLWNWRLRCRRGEHGLGDPGAEGAAALALETLANGLEHLSLYA